MPCVPRGRFVLAQVPRVRHAPSLLQHKIWMINFFIHAEIHIPTDLFS